MAIKTSFLPFFNSKWRDEYIYFTMMYILLFYVFISGLWNSKSSFIFNIKDVLLIYDIKLDLVDTLRGS